MKTAWGNIRLGDISAISYGYTAKASFSEQNNCPKFLRITDIQNGDVDWENVPRCQISNEEISKHRLADNDIVFARTGATTGKSYLIKAQPKSVAASYLIRLRLNDPHFLPKYVSMFFQTKDYWDMVNAGISGSAQGGFNASKLADLCIPKAPLPEQQRIVAILDEVFAGIATAVAHTQKNLANARELFESHLNAVFTQKGQGCEQVELTELTNCITDGDHAPPPKASQGVPFITISNIDKNSHEIDFSETFAVPRKYYDNLKESRRPMKGDVLYTVTGSFGIPVIVDHSREFCFQRHIGLVRPQKNISSKWLYYLLLSKSVYKQAADGATGTAQKTVGLKVLRSILVPRMPLDDQRMIVSVVDDLRSQASQLESLYQQKLDNLTELKQSILQKAFTGELTADRQAGDRVLSEGGL